jgi:hypothetical protein
MDIVQRGLYATGQTLARLPEREKGAGLCLDVSGQAGTILAACRMLDQDSPVLLEKFR